MKRTSLLLIGCGVLFLFSAHAQILYVSDSNFTIHQFSLTGADLGTFADSGDGLTFPEGLAIDASGNVYVANGADNILKFNPSGSPSAFASFANPGALAFYAGDLFAAPYLSGNQVGVFDAGGGLVKTLTIAGLSSPYALTVDNGGNFYVSDNSLGKVVKFDSNGNASTFNSTLTVPTGVAFGNGVLYVAQHNGTIWTIDSSGNKSATPFYSGLSSPSGLAIDPSGNLFVANTGSQDILKISPAGNLLATIGSSSTLSFPEYLAISSVPEPGQWGSVAALALAGFAFLFRFRQAKAS